MSLRRKYLLNNFRRRQEKVVNNQFGIDISGQIVSGCQGQGDNFDPFSGWQAAVGLPQRDDDLVQFFLRLVTNKFI